ncbi:MAG: hypothetical protein MUC31_02940 [Bacteroidales bacterium]|nr:hypothetical protein [Bacteroidales bacterium]
MNTIRNRNVPLGITIALIAVIIMAAALVITVQYNQKKKYTAAMEEFNAAQENHINAIFDRIESNLAKIREKESMISQGFSTTEKNDNLGREERIQHEIEFIEYLLAENNRLIADLNMQIDERNSRLKHYESTVKELKSRIDKYQQDVAVLITEKEALQASLNETTISRNKLAATVDTLNHEIVLKSNEIIDQKKLLIDKDNDLNRAYYAVGTYKELRDRNILQKEGGFLGINRVTSLTGNPDEELFHEIDIREVAKVPIFSKRWEIVTGQDPSSYELSYDAGQLEWLQITDPEKFWKKTNYLVIVIRDKDDDELTLSR